MNNNDVAVDRTNDTFHDTLDIPGTSPVVLHDQLKNTTSNDRKNIPMNFISTNACSLAPKMESLIECFTELDLTFAVITESWLRDDDQLRSTIVDLNEGEDLHLLTRNRKSHNGRRVAGGGVAVAYNRSKINLTKIPVKRGNHEILVATGKIQNLSRKVVIIGIYLPPKIKSEKRKNACLRSSRQ